MINCSQGIAKSRRGKVQRTLYFRIWIKWSWLYRLNRNKMFNCTVLSRRYFLPAFASPFPSLLLSLSLTLSLPFSLLSLSLSLFLPFSRSMSSSRVIVVTLYHLPRKVLSWLPVSAMENRLFSEARKGLRLEVLAIIPLKLVP